MITRQTPVRFPPSIIRRARQQRFLIIGRERLELEGAAAAISGAPTHPGRMWDAALVNG